MCLYFVSIYLKCDLRYGQKRGIVDGLVLFNPNQEDTNAINQMQTCNLLLHFICTFTSLKVVDLEYQKKK
jgi:hypothetical protein